MSTIFHYFILILVFIGHALTHNPENTKQGNLVRPCPNLEVECIRKFFRNCRPPRVQANVVTYDKTFAIPFQVYNFTVVYKSPRLGIDSVSVSDFTINHATGKAVMTIEVAGPFFTSEEIQYKFHNNGAEPLYSEIDFFTLRSESWTITAVIPIHDRYLELEKSTADIYLRNSLTNFSFGSRIKDDPKVKKRLESLIAMPYAAVKSLVYYLSPVYFSAFLQQRICVVPELPNLLQRAQFKYHLGHDVSGQRGGGHSGAKAMHSIA